MQPCKIHLRIFPLILYVKSLSVTRSIRAEVSGKTKVNEAADEVAGETLGECAGESLSPAVQ